MAMRSGVQGILEQLRTIGGLTACALCDGEGRAIALVGDADAAAALVAAAHELVSALPRGTESLFEDGDELGVSARDGAPALLLRRVGQDWALAALWNAGPCVESVSPLAAEAAARLEQVS
jgi:predicted regulator of Ras-like GTPase activity (Roadblock/LC7/MglB family)